MIEFAGGSGLTDPDTAAALLNISGAALRDKVVGGELDAVVISGEPYVSSAALQLMARELLEAGADALRATRTTVRGALVRYLAEREACDDWETARKEGRPLVGLRKGAAATWTRYGIELHPVVVSTRALVEWAAEFGVTSMPELAELPVGPALRAALEELPGCAPVTTVRPLAAGSGATSKTLYGWVRVDPVQWHVRVPEHVALAVGPPHGRA